MPDQSRPRPFLTTLTVFLVAGTTIAGPGDLTSSQKNPRPIPPPIPVPEARGGFYIALFGGANFSDTLHRQSVRDAGCTIDVDLDLDHGGYGGLEFGYATAWSSGFSILVEIEGFYNNVGLDATARTDGRPVAAASGSVDSFAAMGNLLFHYDFGRVGVYAGGGIGYATAELDDVSLSTRRATHDFDLDDGFAWQLVAGLDFALTPYLDLFTEYRFLSYENGTGGARLDNQHLVGGGLRFHW